MKLLNQVHLENCCYLAPREGREVQWWVCLFVRPLACFKNQKAKLHRIFWACCLWLWLGPPMAALRYFVYF